MTRNQPMRGFRKHAQPIMMMMISVASGTGANQVMYNPMFFRTCHPMRPRRKVVGWEAACRCAERFQYRPEGEHRKEWPRPHQGFAIDAKKESICGRYEQHRRGAFFES